MTVNLKKTPINPIDVLLTDGHTRASLAIARSLSRHGISFLILSNNPNCLAFYSRFVKYLLLAPCPKKKPAEFIELIFELIQKYKIKLTIPASDSSLFLLDKYRKSLSRLTKIAIANSQAVQNVLDKRKNLELAKKLGIPCPKQFELKSPHQIPKMIKTLGFPIVLKNPGEQFDSNSHHFKFRVLYAFNEKDLNRCIAQHCQLGVYPLFQECVLGYVYNLCCFAVNGEIIAIHAYRSIRRRGGEGVLRKIIRPKAEWIKYSSILLSNLKWDGVAHVAFFISKDQKKKWYMETNGRFWASLEGSIHAGWDFPYWVYNFFVHGKKPKPGKIKLRSQTCWHYGDLRALLSYLVGGDSPTTGSRPSKLVATLQYLSGFNPIVHSDVFQWYDPLPSVREHGRLLELIWDKIGNRLK